jgi:hypothetical protein
MDTHIAMEITAMLTVTGDMVMPIVTEIMVTLMVAMAIPMVERARITVIPMKARKKNPSSKNLKDQPSQK